MEENMTLRIDPSTRDLVLDEDGILETITGDETSAQAVRLTLETWKGEFSFDPTHGTDYERIMGKKPHELEDDEAGEVARDAIFQENDVEQVDALETKFEGRSLNIAFTGRLKSGAAITTEVKQIE